MKIYEKPSADVKTFEIQDVINTSTASGVFAQDNSGFSAISGNTSDKKTGVVFEW